MPSASARRRRISSRDRARSPAGRRSRSGPPTPVTRPASPDEARRTRPSSSRPADPRERRVVSGKCSPEVPERGRAEQRVGERVAHDVAVGVPASPSSRRTTTPPSSSGRAGRDGWTSNPSPTHGSPPNAIRLGEASASASRRSSGVVILKFPRSPAIARTRYPARSSSTASSVTSNPSRAARSCAFAQRGRDERLRRLRERERRPAARCPRRAVREPASPCRATGTTGTTPSHPSSAAQ